MPRAEFSRKVRRDALRRADGACEGSGERYGLAEGIRCNAPLGYGVEFDHDVPDALEGLNDLNNCRAICIKCHKAKSRLDVRAIRKADRQRDKASGAYKRPHRGLRKPEGYTYDWQIRRYIRTGA